MTSVILRSYRRISLLFKVVRAVSPSYYGREDYFYIYEIEIVEGRNNSKFSDDALKSLSSFGVSNARTRYFIPCGNEQWEKISLLSDIDYPWLVSLSPLGSLFPKKIILRSAKMIKKLIYHFGRRNT